MNKFRLLALDIDGTLQNSRGEVSPRTRTAIARVREAGMLVTLATGRSLRAALPVAETLGLTAPLVLSNGALVLSPATGQSFLHRPLSRSVAVQAARLLQQLDLMVCANRFDPTGPDLFHDRLPHAPEQALVLRREPEYVRQVSDMPALVAALDPLKVMTVDRTPAVEAAADRLRGALTGDFHVLVTPEAPGYSLLEVAPAGISKATGLAWLAEMTGILPAEIIAFGDNFNDLEMLQFAGLGVAMGNAPAGVKLTARMVTATNDDDGIALLLEQQLLLAA
ncbi:MAG TPA: Cof-type HAD-IIB family hydrolase [Symbiobacteriaceae bacterium]|nr:Cof-type HAD-IIB family hydrolase [Symbiobacteriaceae bacterium]